MTLPSGTKSTIPGDPNLDLTKAIITLNVNGQGQTATVNPGQSFQISVTGRACSGSGNPGEIQQLYLIEGWTPTWRPLPAYVIPIVDGGDGSTCPGLTDANLNPAPDVTVTATVVAPSVTGTYYLYGAGDAQYSLSASLNRYSQPLVPPAHAKVIVMGDPISTTSTSTTVTSTSASSTTSNPPFPFNFGFGDLISAGVAIGSVVSLYVGLKAYRREREKDLPHFEVEQVLNPDSNQIEIIVRNLGPGKAAHVQIAVEDGRTREAIEKHPMKPDDEHMFKFRVDSSTPKKWKINVKYKTPQEKDWHEWPVFEVSYP